MKNLYGSELIWKGLDYLVTKQQPLALGDPVAANFLI